MMMEKPGVCILDNRAATSYLVPWEGEKVVGEEEGSFPTMSSNIHPVLGETLLLSSLVEKIEFQVVTNHCIYCSSASLRTDRSLEHDPSVQRQWCR